MIKPIGHLAQPAHAVMALADPAQAMTFAFKQAHPRFHSMMHDRIVHLHALLNRTAVIFKGMDKNRRRFHFIRKLQRRLISDF